MSKIYITMLLYSCLFLLDISKSYGQVSLTNATPSTLIDFSNTTPTGVGTSPQSAFNGSGFSPNPTTAGLLNSNAWAITGWSDGALAFGDTRTTSNTDYTRGPASGAVSTGGIYAYIGTSAASTNPTLMIQPGGSDFAPGTLTLRIQNNGTTVITDLTISYNLYIRNDQDRSNSFNFSHSANNTSYATVTALNYSSPVLADALPAWSLVGSAPSRGTTISGLAILPGSFYYIRWSCADVSGNNSRDEFGLDDINITATFAPSQNFYIAERNGDRLTKLDGAGARTQIGPSITDADGVVLQNATTAFVSRLINTGATILRVDLTTGVQTPIVSLASQCQGLELDIDGNLLVANSGAGKIQKINVGTGTVSDIVTGLFNPIDVFVESPNSLLISEYQPNKITKFNRSTNTRTDFVTGLIQPTDIFRESSTTILVAENGGNITRINLTNGNKTVISNIPGLPHGIARFDANHILVTRFNAADVVKLNLSTGAFSTYSSGYLNPIFIVSESALPPTLSINDISATESNSGTSTFTFTISLSSPAPTGGITFDISTANNTATSGSDYELKSLTSETIPAGSSSYIFEVTVNGDFDIESNETFFVNVTNVVGAIVNDGQGQGTITNDDALITYYPRTTATDLSNPSHWTDNATGVGGNSPVNFTSPNQEFNLSTSVADPTVNGTWLIGGGSNLVLNNTAPLLFTTASSFSLDAGATANFNSRSVILKSSAAGTAYIGQINGTLTGATNVTVERYISSQNNRAYRFLTPSVNTTTTIRQNWQEAGNNVPGIGTHITGSTTGANGFDATQTGQSSLFTLDPVTFAYQPATNTNATTLSAKEGYLLFVRGDRTVNLNTTSQPLPSNNTTLRATGTLLTGPQTFTGLYGNSEFNLVTNPYAAPINWNSVRAASANLTSAYTIWDPNIGSQGGYVTVTSSGIPSNTGSKANINIQSGQAFFVQATAGSASATVNIQESHKSTVNNLDVFRPGSQTEMFTSTLFYTGAGGIRINADGVTSMYSNSFSTEVNDDDAAQLPNWEEDIAISRTGSSLSIEARPLIDERDTIPFTLARLQPKSYEWQFEASNFSHPNLQASLVDKYLGTVTPISLTGTTIISFTVTGASASSAADRFMVVFSPVVALPVNLSNVKAYQKGNDIQVEWTTQTELNMERYDVEKSTNGQHFTKLGSTQARGSNGVNNYSLLDVQANNGANYYRIKGVGRSGEAQYSKVVRVNMGQGLSELIVYPNPLTDNVVMLSLVLPKGTYTLILSNVVGQRVYQKQFVHQGGAATQTIQLDSQLAQGVYRLSVTNGEQQFVQTLTKQ